MKRIVAGVWLVEAIQVSVVLCKCNPTCGFCLFASVSPEESSDTLKVAAYIFIGVGSLSMAMGFFGCIGAIYEIRCLLGLVRKDIPF